MLAASHPIAEFHRATADTRLTYVFSGEANSWRGWEGHLKVKFGAALAAGLAFQRDGLLTKYRDGLSFAGQESYRSLG
ncbi:hypothetical protein BraRD5C2_39650 [Bradyrhizobium sp. RD5-C2]|nr:hypothetical protein BraRD5C2_39650 [Bradyrhizobium sp. RD5-C2]